MARPAPVETDDSAIPAAMRRFFHNRASELAGVGLLAITGAIVVALASWQADDPSLSYAVDKEPGNLLGEPGAVVADLLMQSTGLGVIAFIVPLIAWACRWLAHGKIEGPFKRIPAWLLGTALFSGAMSSFAVPSGWALKTGLGGVVGDMVILPITLPLETVTGGFVAHLVSFLVFFAAAIFMVFYACGLSRDEVSAVRTNVGARGQNAAVRVGAAIFNGAMFTREKISALKENRENRLPPPVQTAPVPEAPAEPAKPAFIQRSKHWSGDEQESIAQPVEPLERREPVFGESMLPPPAPRPAAQEFAQPDEAFDDDVPFDLGDEASISEAAVSERITPTAAPPKQGTRVKKEKIKLPKRKSGPFQLPPLALLSEPSRVNRGTELSDEQLEANARLLEGVLEDFGVRGEIINVRPGPVVTLYELEPAPGIKSSRVIGLADDIARSMSAISARVAVVPGRNAIGIELPNTKRETVFLRELLASEPFESSKHSLNIALGKNIGGEPIFADLARMPHLLIAGTTGSGKSVGINTMILSLLYRLSPDKCKLIMIDPKMLELSVYEGIPHLLAPVVTDPKKAVVSLKWAVREMEDRYRKMSKLGVRNVDGFNARVEQAAAKGEVLTRTVQTGYDPETGQPVYEEEEMPLEPMPYIVVIIDEMADLMMVAGKDIEGAVQRLAQMARAAGIHVVMATQRPSVDVITGTIKANFPTRISFQVTSKIDSRTILGEMGAEQLLGQGDMLYMAGGGRISRLHGAFVSDDEVEQIVRHLKDQGAPEYVQAVTEEEEGAEGDLSGMLPEGTGDELYDKAVAIVIRDKKASTSYIQRRLQIGYNRAATLIEKMEAEGVIGPANHAGKRDILVGGADETIPDQEF
ncbi:MAG: DNA translocase FtsK [Hyphomicrobiales bacterium]